MKQLTILLSLALAVAVAAQDIASLAAAVPACAVPVYNQAAEEAGCSATDYVCQCGVMRDVIDIGAMIGFVSTSSNWTTCTTDLNANCEFLLLNVALDASLCLKRNAKVRTVVTEAVTARANLCNAVIAENPDIAVISIVDTPESFA